MAQDNREFKLAIRDIATQAPKLPNAFGKSKLHNVEHYVIFFVDRVRCSEWAKKLASLPDDNLEMAKLRNEYIQLLRIQVRNKFLHGIFAHPPPEDSNLCPLSEQLGNMLAEQV